MDSKQKVDQMIEVFMRCATKASKIQAKGSYGHTSGLEWGHAWGVYDTLTTLEIISEETAAELHAVLFSRKEEA